MERREAGRGLSTETARLRRRRRWWLVAQGSIRPSRGSIELEKGAEEMEGEVEQLGTRGIEARRREVAGIGTGAASGS